MSADSLSSNAHGKRATGLRIRTGSAQRAERIEGLGFALCGLCVLAIGCHAGPTGSVRAKAPPARTDPAPVSSGPATPPTAPYCAVLDASVSGLEARIAALPAGRLSHEQARLVGRDLTHAANPEGAAVHEALAKARIPPEAFATFLREHPDRAAVCPSFAERLATLQNVVATRAPKDTFAVPLFRHDVEAALEEARAASRTAVVVVCTGWAPGCDELKRARLAPTARAVTWIWADVTDDTTPLAKRFSVRAVPTVLVLDGAGHEVGRKDEKIVHEDLEPLLERAKMQ